MIAVCVCAFSAYALQAAKPDPEPSLYTNYIEPFFTAAQHVGRGIFRNDDAEFERARDVINTFGAGGLPALKGSRGKASGLRIQEKSSTVRELDRYEQQRREQDTREFHERRKKQEQQRDALQKAHGEFRDADAHRRRMARERELEEERYRAEMQRKVQEVRDARAKTVRNNLDHMQSAKQQKDLDSWRKQQEKQKDEEDRLSRERKKIMEQVRRMGH